MSYDGCGGLYTLFVMQPGYRSPKKNNSTYSTAVPDGDRTQRFRHCSKYCTVTTCPPISLSPSLPWWLAGCVLVGDFNTTQSGKPKFCITRVSNLLTQLFSSRTLCEGTPESSVWHTGRVPSLSFRIQCGTSIWTCLAHLPNNTGQRSSCSSDTASKYDVCD